SAAVAHRGELPRRPTRVSPVYPAARLGRAHHSRGLAQRRPCAHRPLALGRGRAPHAGAAAGPVGPPATPGRVRGMVMASLPRAWAHLRVARTLALAA